MSLGSFIGWRRGAAVINPNMVSMLLRDVANTGHNVLYRGIIDPPKTGRMYRYKGRSHQASRIGEFPATRSGALAKSIRSTTSVTTATLGTTTKYGGFLKRKKRKMSSDALGVAVPTALKRQGSFARFRFE
jgi:hypothetical protein